ncbi:MAG: sulfatase-like hydrolase/transferase [Candidatus Eisenbacteria bacterium]|nr:sulfatase-like hydrolase/transferase [Candidatus Eisenbacteria bacterium]
MRARAHGGSTGSFVGATLGGGLLIFAGLALLEWIVLVIKLPVVWSGSLAAVMLWNVLLYAGFGVVAGAAAVLVGLLLRAATGGRWTAVTTPAGGQAFVFAGSVFLYWVLSLNRLSPHGATHPVSLALDVLALAIALVLLGLFLRRAARSGRPVFWRVCVLVLLFILPVYWAGAGGVDRIEGAADLGPADIESGRPVPDVPNIVLIMLDTTRIDCLGCYGSVDGLSPSIDALADDSVLFEACVTPEPLTRPAAATLFTGLYPMSHGVDTNTKSLPGEITTLAELLRDRGYATGAFAAATVLSSYYGTDQGFDTYVEPTETPWTLHRALALRQLVSALGYAPVAAIELPADMMTDRAATWIEANHGRPFFAYVHYFDPHWPYEPPPAFDFAAEAGLADVPVPYDDPQDRFRTDFEMPRDFLMREWLRYQGEIRFMDREVGRLFDELDRLGLRDDTIVVLVSDHGEGFEHQFYFAHGNRLYDQLVAVAMMVRVPGVEPRRVPTQVTLLEVCPTILGLVDVDPPPGVQGLDLSAVVRDGVTMEGDLPAFCQTDFENPKPLSSRVSVGLRLPPWKYIDSPEIELEELYDLEADPAETVNLAEELPDVRRDMSRRVTEWLATTQTRAVEVEQLSPERIEALRALGYLE